jgi:fluoroacetyl-CoA thioesterase
VTRAELQAGATGRAELMVGTGDLASNLALQPGDEFPPVLATSRMIALMEIAAARLLTPLLAPGEMSVGVTVDITHSAATQVGQTVHAEARFANLAGKLYVFDVVAQDAGGEIGRGTHSRAIVRTERLMNGAGKRAAEH